MVVIIKETVLFADGRAARPRQAPAAPDSRRAPPAARPCSWRHPRRPPDAPELVSARPPPPTPSRPELRPDSVSRQHRGVRPVAHRCARRGVQALPRRRSRSHGVDLELPPGEAVALLGPNGAGKTTLLVDPGRGRRAPAPARRSGGPTPSPGSAGCRSGRRVYGRLTARENLRLFAALEGAADPAPRRRAAARAAPTSASSPTGAADRLSTGTLQRLNLAVALAGEPARCCCSTSPPPTLSPDQRVPPVGLAGRAARAGGAGAALLHPVGGRGRPPRATACVVLAGRPGGVLGRRRGAGGGHDDGGRRATRPRRAFLSLVGA